MSKKSEPFLPTCPRCWRKAPSKAKWCPNCGAWMMYDPPPKRKPPEQQMAA